MTLCKWLNIIYTVKAEIPQKMTSMLVKFYIVKNFLKTIYVPENWNVLKIYALSFCTCNLFFYTQWIKLGQPVFIVKDVLTAGEIMSSFMINQQHQRRTVATNVKWKLWKLNKNKDIWFMNRVKTQYTISAAWTHTHKLSFQNVTGHKYDYNGDSMSYPTMDKYQVLIFYARQQTLNI